MPSCPDCFGNGGHDMADMDAYLAEHLPPSILARMIEAAAESGREWGGWLRCEECEGTGVVSEERLKDLVASARAQVDQALARIEHELRLGKEETP